MTTVAAIGTIAALCTTGSFIPQIFKIRRQGGEDLSYSMLLVYLIGVFLWLIYGIMFHAPAVIWANAAAMFLVGTSITMKAAWNEKQQAPEGRLRVAVDMDEVIADALTRHLDLYNQATGENVSAETISKMGLERAIRYAEVF
jgi:MtN3 and saliva related transmembrane protein